MENEEFIKYYGLFGIFFIAKYFDNPESFSHAVKNSNTEELSNILRDEYMKWMNR